MKNITKSNKALFTALVLVAVFAVGAFVRGYNGSAPKTVIENVENYNEAEEQVVSPEPQLGAFPGPDIYEPLHFRNGRIGASLNIPLRYPTATSTAMTDMILGVKYFDEDVFLYNWGWAITEQNDDSGMSDFGIGTTTLTSGSRFEAGVSSLTNSTTRTMVAASQIATSSDNITFDIWGYADVVYGGTGVEGNKVTSTIGSFYETLGVENGGNRISTTSPLFIPAGTVLVVSCSGDCAATSSDAITTGDAANFKGMFYGELIYQVQN